MRILALLDLEVSGAVTLTVIFALFSAICLKTRFAGIRKIPAAARAVFSHKKGKNSPLSSACVSLSATVGTGNIVGVAGAVTLGGPGAVFWMWVSAFFAMSVKYFEIYVSSVYKDRSGVFGYVYDAIKIYALKRAFPVLGIIAAFGIGNLTQTNAAATAAAVALERLPLSHGIIRALTGIVFAVASVLVLRRRAAAIKFCEKFLPLMAAAYIVLCMAALFSSKISVASVLSQIIKGAFCPKAVTGGAVGSVVASIKSGTARGIFSNEAGLSTAALAYEKNSARPETAALFGIFEVFVDTVALCTLTALVILSSKAVAYGEDLGAYTTLCAFINALGRASVPILCAVICFFAFSSVIGWGIYLRRFGGELNANSAVLTAAYAASCIFGAVFKARAAWQIAEISSVLLLTINCIALIRVKSDKKLCKKHYKHSDQGNDRKTAS